KFLQRPSKRKQYAPFSGFPPASRDLALLVDATAAAGQVRRAVEKLAQKACPKEFGVERIDIFDVYLGEGLPEGKKSVALNLAYRAPDRTLKDKEVNLAFDALQQAIAGKTDYVVRR
ncbi:MAG: phenylalanine--tRNA ligase subunit beta, partial [Opitutales bacterium]